MNKIKNSKFWNGRKVFLTGHTGFKGSWLSLWLSYLGAEVTGYSLLPPTSPSLFLEAKIGDLIFKSIIGDIRNLDELTDAMQSAEPEIVIHMAAQSLVHDSYSNPVETYSTNLMGTVNLYESIRRTDSVKAVINVTTDKCYENKEWQWGYRENDRLGGYDPYSASKACSEIVSSSYNNSFFKEKSIALATVRAGNVIGGGDWAKDRIIPDIIRSFIECNPVYIRSPNAIRPWQHVLEPLSGYLILSERLLTNSDKYSSAWNFGPDDSDAITVSSITELMVKKWGEGATWEMDDRSFPHEANYLKLDCSKSKYFLNWSPVWNVEKALEETTDWYKAWHNGQDMAEFSISQIRGYQQNQLNFNE